MSIVDEIRVKQSYGPEGYKFEVLPGDLTWEPMRGDVDEILVTLQNIPLVFFGGKIPVIEASTLDLVRGKVRIASSHITEHRSPAGAYSYRANVGFYIPACNHGKSISFYLDNKLLYIGMPREHRWVLAGNRLQLNCQEMMI